MPPPKKKHISGSKIFPHLDIKLKKLINETKNKN